MLREIHDVDVSSEVDRRRIADGAALGHDGQSRLLVEDPGDIGGDLPRHESVAPVRVGIQQLTIYEIAPELTGHGLPLSKCEAYNRVYEQPYESN